MQTKQNLERIKSFTGCGELSTPEREELSRLRTETIAPIKTFKGHSIKPFPCTFCHQPTLQICRDTRKPNTDNQNLVTCCKECKIAQNGDKPYLAVSSIYKEVA